MRILLFGKNGQLGWELQRALACLGNVIAYDFPEVDFTKPESLRPIIGQVEPALIINAAAYTDVDKAESEPEKARLINAKSVGILAEESLHRKIPLIHYSTDYVFDGTKDIPYTEEDASNPINVYGQTKLEGEKAISQVGGAYWIFRTSWVYSLRKGGFVNKVLEWSREQPIVRIVDDQIGSPTWARLLAEFTTQLVSGYRDNPYIYIRKYSGVYHVAGDGFCSRYDWAKAILEFYPDSKSQFINKITPCKSDEFPSPAIRPAFTALDCGNIKHTFGLSLPAWKDGLNLCIA
ncbi:MAG: dTDP-4-dehydrorhamnose reductase [Anaerolineaceae bacterium]